jgi:jumonji domain-containing protein 2
MGSIHMESVPCERLDNPSKKKVKLKNDDDDRTPDGGFKVKTYYPTLEEMKDFNAYIKYIHEDGGHRAGLAKIVPPAGYEPRKGGYNDEKLYQMEITCPIRQEVTGEGGLYQQMNIVDRKKMSVRNFKRLSEEKHPTPLHTDQAALDRIFWKNVFTNPSIYGADVPGTLFDDDFDAFNLTRLRTILDDIQDDYGVTIQGVNTTYLYFGMWKSSFCWHTEDMDLYSINYLHTGAPKSWYCIAPEYGRRFERLAESFFPHSFKNCKAFLRHKTTLISPQVLKKYSIPFSRCTQEAGQFMITFPYSYHSGYNNGFNIAEATNFATEHWIDFGKWATRCECSAESVKISMQTFVKRYQADRYELWIRGKDVCKDPRDPKHVAPAPKPTEHDLYVMGVHERMSDESYIEGEEEDDKKKVALQQNLSSNLKSKSKSHKKKVKSIEETYQCYNEYLMSATNHIASNITPTLPHYSPIPTNMIQTTECVPIRSCDKLSIDDFDSKEKPDYDRILKKNDKKDKMKSKRDERLNQKKEKRAKERMIASHELLQFLPVTFTHEKKFNRCIAALPPHCSVCQLLVIHPKDDENIWGQKPNTDSETSTHGPQTEAHNQDLNSDISGGLDIKPSKAGSRVEEFELPEKSNILLPRSAFSDHGWVESDSDAPDVDVMEDVDMSKTKSDVENMIDTNSTPENALVKSNVEMGSSNANRIRFLDLNVDEPCELLQCTVCMLAVHKLCYGIDEMPAIKKDWICDRCIEPNRSTINCALCPCRGGALKSIDGTWVHITCALTLPNMKLTDLTSSGLKKKELKLPEVNDRNSCVYCAKNTNLTKYVQGKCIACRGLGLETECGHLFHPTCGHRNGALFKIFDHHRDPKIEVAVEALCADCTKVYDDYQTSLSACGSSSPEEPDLEPIAIGSHVIAYSRKGAFYDGVVQSLAKKTTYDLFFPHANEIDQGVPEKNIIDVEKTRDYKVGDKLRVKQGGTEVIGKFRLKRSHNTDYIIKFDRSNQTERVARRNIYLNVDQLPDDQVETYLSNNSAKRSLDEDFVT